MIFIFLYFYIFIFGLAVGSFLNCVIYRLEKGESFLKGRSHCPQCGHTLSWLDLIPILSFLFLKGKCRYCEKIISWQYPAVELATGALFLLISNFQFPVSSQFPIINFQIILVSGFWFLISSFLIVIFVYDLKHYIIPDRVIYPAIVIAAIFQLFRIWNFGNWDFFGIWNLGFGILPAFFLLAIILFSRGLWMGMGDFKLGILMGLILGWPKIIPALFLAFFLGAIIGTGLILAKRKALRSEVPFGPFLATGTFLALFYGDQIINWYLSFLL